MTPEPEQVLAIRQQFDAGTLNVREWADMLGCSLETIRRIARRDTYRNLRAGQRIEGPHFRGTTALSEEPPTEAELVESFKRLQAQVSAAPQSGREVDSFLNQLTEQGKQDAEKNR